MRLPGLSKEAVATQSDGGSTKERGLGTSCKSVQEAQDLCQPTERQSGEVMRVFDHNPLSLAPHLMASSLQFAASMRSCTAASRAWPVSISNGPDLQAQHSSILYFCFT